MSDRMIIRLWEPVSAWTKIREQVWPWVKPMLVAGHRLVLEIKPEPKSRAQEKKYHAQIRDIARQFQHAGRSWADEDMKRLLVDAFRRDTKGDETLAPYWRAMGEFRLAPAIGADGFVALGYPTKQFPKPLASAFIEWLNAFGAENGVVWSEAIDLETGEIREAA